MRVPRFRMASVMALIAIAAFDFGAIRAWFDYHRTPAADYLLLGALPMANVLMIGMLAGRRRLASRPFLLGFQVFGAMALAIYLFLATFSPQVPATYVGPSLLYVARTFWRYGPFVRNSVISSSAAVMLVLPQVALALIGGFLFRRFRTAERRRTMP